MTPSSTHRATRIDVTTLRDGLSHETTPRILDVRSPGEFETAHIPGSHNVPLDLLRANSTEVSRHLDEHTVLVCQSGSRAEQARGVLEADGLSLRVLEGGMSTWTQEDAPVVRGRETWALERQVRFVAGGIVAASVLASTVAPRVKWAAAGIGSGLVFAAVTDTCAMGTALSKMPWNRGREQLDVHHVVAQLRSA